MQFQGLVLLASALQFFNGAYATDLEKRVTVNAPAMGIELECRHINFLNSGNKNLKDDYALSAAVKVRAF